MAGEDDEDTSFLKEMAKDAANYLQSFSWCASVKRLYFGKGVGGVVAVFLAEITPAKAGVDDWLWVVVGDLPPAYFVTDLKTPLEVVEAYIDHRTTWVNCVLGTHPLGEDVMPVNIPATPENAKLLSTRLDVLREHFLPFFGEV